MLRTIAIVGASLSGLRVAETLRQEGFAGCIRLVGAEDALPYDRPPLSKQFLRGEWDERRIALCSPEELAALDLELELGTQAVSLDRHGRHVVLADGRQVDYDAVVIATGAASWRPLAWELGGVFDLRTLADARQIAATLAASRRLVVIGAGFIGCEVAASARQLGVEVDLVEALPFPLARSLGALVGAYCADLHRSHGVRAHLGVAVDGLVGENGRVRAVRLASGELLETDVVIVGLGVQPVTDWLVASGLDIGDGVLCDENGRAGPGVYAVGDVARWRRAGEPVRIEHWTNAVEQATHVGRHLLARPDGSPAGGRGLTAVPYFWSDQYTAKISAFGLPAPGDEAHVLAGALGEDRFVVGYRRGDRLSGTVVVNWPRMLRVARQELSGAATWVEASAALTAAGEAERAGGTPSKRTPGG